MKPKQFFFTLLGLLFIVIAGGGYAYYFATQQLSSQSQQLATDQAETQTASAQITTLEVLESNYNHNVAPYLSIVDAAIPSDKNQTEILAQIERIAQNDGVQQPFKSISMPAPTGLPSDTSQTLKSGSLLVLPISFEADGTYEQLQAFTYDLETLNRYTNVTSLAINAANKTSPVSYTFTVNAYVYP